MMKAILSLLLTVLGLTNASAQQIQALKTRQPVAGKKITIQYDATSTALAAADTVSGIAIYYHPQKKSVTQQFQLKKQKAIWAADIRIPANTVVVYLVFTDAKAELKDNNEGKGYLLPVYKQGKPVQFAYSQMAFLTGEGPPDPYGLKKNQKTSLAFMKKEMGYHPESEPLLRQQFYNMLANSPEREDKADLVKRLSTLKSDQETDLMMAQLYLSFFGTKQQADSLDRLLIAKFPNGNYVKQKQLKEEPPGKATIETHAESASQPAVIKKIAVDTARLAKELSEGMLKEPVATLTLKDMNGNDVALGAAELKGKVMVIDFWATWCKPCIKSFPGMKKVMDKYKDNPEVEFFYICTMEHGDAISNVKEFLSKNPFPFKILIDEKTTDMNLDRAFSHYTVEGGIPYKLVIDGRGNVRFRTVGFSGDDETLVTELSTMIDLTIKAK
jgi:thiol-disulfide isomerase/thioredoxin